MDTTSELVNSSPETLRTLQRLMTTPLNRPMRILMVLHMPWNRSLGGSRVQLELAEEFQSLGHEVEKFDIHNAFPSNNSSQLKKLIRPNFSVKAKAFVKANAHRFDVIDAHQGNLPFSKQELRFQGLLVARSVGLYAFYEEFAKSEKAKVPPKHLKTLLGNSLRSWRSSREKSNYPRSLQTCDLINVCNHDELVYVRDSLGFGEKCVFFPFGLSQQRREALVKATQPAKARLINQQVTFIGNWGTRKGSRDWAKIVRQVKEQMPGVRFQFLGTGVTAEAVLADLNLDACDWIEIISRYDSEELPKLLSKATVGAFPSYIEGFGFAVLEKLGCGLPTVAYDVPGPREMLRHLDNSLLTPAGDVDSFSSKLINLLKLDEVSYTQLSQHCVEVSQRFDWRSTAKEVLGVYSNLLKVQKEVNGQLSL